MAHCYCPALRKSILLNIASSRKDKNSKFQVQFILNANHFHTIVKSKIIGQAIINWGPSVSEFARLCWEPNAPLSCCPPYLVLRKRLAPLAAALVIPIPIKAPLPAQMLPCLMGRKEVGKSGTLKPFRLGSSYFQGTLPPIHNSSTDPSWAVPDGH